MGEYEELCEQMGLSPGSEEDYDRLTEMMVHGGERPRPHSPNDFDEGRSRTLIFVTFREACEWSKNHGGIPFTRSVDGRYFTPVGSECANPTTNNSTQIGRAEVRAFLRGAAAPGSTWLPGTYVGFAETAPMETSFERDQLIEKQYFLPRLSALAPRIAREKETGKYSTFGLSKLMATPFHQAQSTAQVQELLELLEGKLVRAKRWYATQAAANGEEIEHIRKRYQEIPSPFQAMGKLWDYRRQYGKIPDELSFWQGAVEIAREAHANRIEMRDQTCDVRT